MKKTGAIIFLLIILLAMVTRIYRIANFPPHLYWDEASIAYNAYSVNLTGKDEWGEHDPFIFKSFGDYKLPFYIYVVAQSQRIFGLADFAVRLPSVLAGILTVAVMYFLVREEALLVREKFRRISWINKSDVLALLAMLFLAISPWHLQFSRGGFEANLALFLQGLGTLLFLLAMRKNIRWLYLSVVCFVASVYTYHSATLTAPLLLGILTVLFWRRLYQEKKQVIMVVILGLILLIPFFPSYLLSAHGRIRATAESVTHMPGNVVSNFLNNYVGNFSFDYLFFKGDQNGRHSVKKIGELFLWQLPAVLAGIYFLLKYRSKTSIIILVWLLVAAIPPALTRVSPHALRGLLAVSSWQILAAIGTIVLLVKFKPWLRYFLVPVVAYAFLTYLHLYYVHSPKAYATDWQDGSRQAVEFLSRVEDRYDKIYLAKGLSPIYILLYKKIDPRILHANGHKTEKIGKYEYHDLYTEPTKDDPAGKNLVVTPAWMGLKYNLIREIRNSYGEPIFNVYEY